MSAEKCGEPKFAFPARESIVVNPELPKVVLSEKATALLRKIRQKLPDWSPSTVKELYNKAYKMGLFEDEQD